MSRRPLQRIAGTAAAILAAALVLTPTPDAGAAGLLIAEGGLGGVLEIEEQRVQVTINNGIAVTEVTQVFRNTENRQVEALYTFPVPAGASVANFSMWINGKEMVGEVVEKQRARQIYDSYRQVRRDPGLLEQADFKTFEMRIFPIAARAEQRVQVTYYQELDFDHDQATYVYPLATVTRTDLTSQSAGTFALTLDVKSEVPVVQLDSPSHGDQLAVVRHGDRYWRASLETPDGSLARDVVVAFQVARPRTGLDLVASRDGREDGYFQLTLTAGEELADTVGGMDYVFVLDVSGSMDRDGKLGLSRGSVSAFLDELGDDDRLEVMAFNVAPATLFGQLRSADEGARAEARQFLAEQSARGGTSLQSALELAYQYANADRRLNVVVLSDGMTEQRERTTLLSMIQAQPAGTRVFCIGVGNEVDRPLLSQVAEEAGGLAAFVSQGDDFERQARAFRRKLMRPVASNVEVDIQGVGVYDLVPNSLPDLFHGAPVRIYGRYRQPGEAKVRFRADIGGETIDRWLDLEFPESDTANPEIERMWAWHRIETLLRDADRKGSRAAVVDEVVRLGEGFSIVTEYTSFLVLENDGEYQRWQIERRNALRVERDRTAQARLREQLEALRSASTAALGPAPPEEKDQRLARATTPPSTQTQTRSVPVNPSQSQPQPRRRRNVDLPNLGGGGALDPLSAGLVLALGALCLVALRRHLG